MQQLHRHRLLSQGCHGNCGSASLCSGSSCVLRKTLFKRFLILRRLFHFSIAQYTRCLLLCARRPPHLGCVHLAAANAHVVPPFRKASLRFTCIVQPPPYPDGKFTPAASYGGSIVGSPLAQLLLHWPEKGLPLYCCPLMGARRHFRSFLPPVPYGGSPPTLQCGQVCHTAMLLFCRRRYYLLLLHRETFM